MNVMISGFFFIALLTGYWAHVVHDDNNAGHTKSPRDLRADLFKNYDKSVRPVKDYTESITLLAGLAPIFIRELDEEREILILDSWIKMYWEDSYLTWNPDDYDGMKNFNIPTSEVWRPDITVYSGSPDNKIVPQVFTNAIINFTGGVMWVPPVTLSSRCPLDLSEYPYDTQLCVIKLGSWTYGKSRMDIQSFNPLFNLDDFMDTNPHWSVVGVTAARHERIYPCCPDEPYPSLEFNVTLRRKQSMPVKISKTVSIFAGFLALLMFWLPPDSMHKIILGALADIFLGITVLYVGSVIPAPVASLKAAERIYPVMYAVSAALIIEVLVMNLARVMGPCRPPRCLVATAKGCCTLCCVCISRAYPGGDLRAEVGHSDKLKKRPSAQEEWYLVSMALDRILFILSLAISICFYKLC